MRFTLRRSLAVTAGAAALLGGALIAPNLAGAQTTESFTVSPTSAYEGQTVTFTVTGCVLEGVDSPAFGITLFDNVFAFDQAVDADGTGSYAFTIPAAEDLEPGSNTFIADCYDPENTENGFVYEDQAVLDITAAPPSSSTSTSTSTTAAPAAAAAATVTPAFTG